MPSRLHDRAGRESGSAVTMAATWCKSQTLLDRVAARNGRRAEIRWRLTRFLQTAGRYTWPTYPNGSLESWLQISPTSRDLTGPATERGFISDPTNLAGWESIVVPCPEEMPSRSRKISMDSVRGSLSMGRQYICKPRREVDAEESGSAGAARHGIRSGGIASPEQLRPLDPLTRRYLFCSCRCAQISPLL